MTWTLLVITVSSAPVAYVPFSDPMVCGNALPVIHSTIEAEWPDAIVQCIDSGIPKVRPRARPEVRS